MSNEDAESFETREVLNETLKDILSTDGWGRSSWDTLVKVLREDFKIETDLLEMAQHAPGLTEMFQLEALSRKGIIKKKTREKVSQIIHQLVRIAYRADEGDERFLDQLKAIHKLSYPQNYDLPATVIKNLVDSYHTSPHLARAWSVRDLMLELSYVVEPVRGDISVLESKVKLTTTDMHLLNPEIYGKAERHIKKGSTLQSLAMSIYLDDLSKEGINLNLRQLKLDLQKLREWEVANHFDASDGTALWNGSLGQYPEARIPGIPIYSEAWKTSFGRGDKKREKLS